MEDFHGWDSRSVRNRNTIRYLSMPGGFLLVCTAVLVHSGWVAIAPATLNFLYYATLAGGILLAWRFHSSRILLALLLIFIAEEAIGWSGSMHAVPGTLARATLVTVCVFVPLDLVLVAFMNERGFTVSGTAPMVLFLFVQAVFVTVLVRSTGTPQSFPHRAVPALPESVLVLFAGGGLILFIRSLFTHKPTDIALFWSAAAFFLSVYFSNVVRVSGAYSVCALITLATSLMETSYLLAYHDELTTLPARRAFNECLRRLQEPYGIAVVDIDHFKKFNDTHGHDVGDEVLRLVAAKLADVTGGGQAYRCGGEEFAIIFRGKNSSVAAEHLEQLRIAIEAAEFRVRGSDRRQVPRGPDRRAPQNRGRKGKGNAVRLGAGGSTAVPLSVTVSIGVADSSEQRSTPDLVLRAADKALYRAKANGRNRLEVASAARRRVSPKAAGVA